MLKRMTAAGVIAAIVWIALSVLGCDLGGPPVRGGLPVRLEQDVEVYVPGYPPGEEDQEDKAQTFEEE